MKVIETMAKNQVVLANFETGGQIFQSYDSIIAIRIRGGVKLSEHYNYSRTTMKYLGKFLNMNAKEIHQAVKDGIFKVSIDTSGMDL
jgi:hypothetical protein